MTTTVMTTMNMADGPVGQIHRIFSMAQCSVAGHEAVKRLQHAPNEPAYLILVFDYSTAKELRSEWLMRYLLSTLSLL